MTISSRLTFKPLLQRSAVALAMAALSVGASAALPPPASPARPSPATTC